VSALGWVSRWGYAPVATRSTSCRNVESIATTPAQAYVSIRQIAELFDVSQTQARRLTKRPGFPARREISARCPRWKLNEVIEWADAQQRLPQLLPDTIPAFLLGAKPRGPKKRALADDPASRESRSDDAS
jgi:predicted DNA-binding transcriptional regulator AlpA